MFTHLQVMWMLMRSQADRLGPAHDQRGSVVETVIITAVFAAFAISIGAIIVSKITTKTNSINLH